MEMGMVMFEFGKARRTGMMVAASLLAFVPAAHAQQPVPPAQAPVTLQLSMDQAVAMALETNLGLKADRLDVGIAAQSVAGARAAFRPQLRTTFSRNTSDQLPSSFVEGNAVVSSGST